MRGRTPMITLEMAQKYNKINGRIEGNFGTEMSTNVKLCPHNVSRIILNCDSEINVLNQQETQI
jgi:hypothetical protein